MSSLKHLFRNRLVLAVFIGLILLSLLCISTVNRELAEMEWQEATLQGYDWLIPMGIYDGIHVAEMNGTVYFTAEIGTERELDGTIYKSNGTYLAVTEEYDWFLNLCADREHLQLDVHPAGYGITQRWAGAGKEYVWDMERKRLTEDFDRFSLQLTEASGYAIDRIQNTVISLTDGSVVYRAKSDERIVGQDGDYWILERDIPWPDAGLTLTYLRDMEFGIALNGMLFDSVYDVHEGRILGTVITSGTYYALPEEVISVENRFVEADGSWEPLFEEGEDNVLVRGQDGFYILLDRETEEQTLCYMDGTEPLQLSEGTEPVAVNDGIVTVETEDGKMGYLDLQGNVIAEPIFSQVSIPHKNLAVVVFNGDVGVIRLKGGGGSE